VTGRRRGFTLWELGLVLLLMSIATLVAIPAYTRLGAPDLDAGGPDELLRLLRASRKAAIAHGVTVTLLVDPETGRYRADSSGATGTGPLAADTLALGRAHALDTELPRLRYVFRPTGAALGDTVRVRGRDGTVLVAVDAWSGEARADAR
jgi:Tfp pilus assembly protein FimT